MASSKKKIDDALTALAVAVIMYPMKTTRDNSKAKAAAMAKIRAWADVQSRAATKKIAARASGNTRAADLYFRAEVAASCRRSKHEQALVVMDRMEREAAELMAWEARVRK